MNLTFSRSWSEYCGVVTITVGAIWLQVMQTHHFLGYKPPSLALKRNLNRMLVSLNGFTTCEETDQRGCCCFHQMKPCSGREPCRGRKYRLVCICSEWSENQTCFHRFLWPTKETGFKNCPDWDKQFIVFLISGWVLSCLIVYWTNRKLDSCGLQLVFGVWIRWQNTESWLVCLMKTAACSCTKSKD